LDYEDPGWRPALRKAPLILLPFTLPLVSRPRGVDGITSLRVAFLHLIVTQFEFLLVLNFLTDAHESGGAGWYLFLVIGVGLYALAISLLWLPKRLDVTNAEKLAASYRATLFIGIGLVYSAALFGFAGVFLTRDFVLYPLGMAFSLAGLLLLIPSQANIRRWQDKIRARGSTLSLGRALLESAY